MNNDKAKLAYAYEQASRERMEKEAYMESLRKSNDENTIWMIACGVLAIMNVLQVIF